MAAASEAPCHQQRLSAAVDTLRALRSRVLFWLGLLTPSVSTLVRSFLLSPLFIFPAVLCSLYSVKTFLPDVDTLFAFTLLLFFSLNFRGANTLCWKPLTSPDRPAGRPTGFKPRLKAAGVDVE